MVDKATNTEPLIILSPDKVINFQDGLTSASFQKSLKIFIDTIGRDIVYCKPRLDRPSTPTTQLDYYLVCLDTAKVVKPKTKPFQILANPQSRT